ncbi:MAG TPA: amylo-alpha-1,6-glucosidase, partial [Thermoanaerobaculia bacterium]|nr:amylo-alpha-1,6-glucosidase [Thermoanaerobaculia bacterium]
GGFACGSAGGRSMRRYHGWYAPPAAPALRRSPLVAGCEEHVWCGGETAIFGQGPGRAGDEENGRRLVRFALEPFPTWRYETGRFAIERSLFLFRGRPIAIVRYLNRGARSVGLRAKPLLRAGRKPRAPGGELARDPAVAVREDAAWISSLPGSSPLYLRGCGGRAVDESWRVAEAPEHAEPDGGEGLWSPVAWDWILAPQEEAYLLFSREEVSTNPAQLLEAERERRQAFGKTDDPVFDELARRAEVFLVDGDSQDGAIIPGYPEPGEGGRDSMISVPGLTLASARYSGAARVVGAAAARLSAALAGDEPDAAQMPAEFASSDAPLWFVLAVEWFTRLRRNPSRPTPLLGAVRSVLSAYRGSRMPGISVGPDGLVNGFLAGRPLTWMNAMFAGEPVTPRYGRAVEVNALWHASLKAAARLERLAGERERARELESEAWRVARRFNEVFWFTDGESLYDVVGPEGSDASLRPNQIFAVSLSDDLLPPHRARAVYWAVRSRLLTPFGLRTLDPRDPRYRGRSSDSVEDRALALHQGAAWPWLLGAFADAHFRVLGQSEETRRSMQLWLERLKAHVAEAGVGSISEAFDGDEPQTPRGCFAEARSVAEIARILYTYLKNSS